MYTTLLGCPLPLVLGWFSAGSASAAWDLGARFPMVCGCLFYERGGCPGFFRHESCLRNLKLVRL